MRTGQRKRAAEDRVPHEDQPLNVPLRSLKRSSGCGGLTSGVCGNDGLVLAAAGAVATVVSDEELPHNFCTAGETG
jgi:hypothetical protein